MRATHLFEQQLLEHNVVNRDDIAQYVEEFAARCTNPNAQEWFRVALARWLEKEDQINVPMGNQMPHNAPDWVDAAVARGDDLRVFHPPIHMNAAFDHLVDYFDWLGKEGEKFKAARAARARGESVEDEGQPPMLDDRARVLKVTVETALKKADDWTKTGAKAALKTKVTDVTEVMEDGIYTWVEPTTIEALKRDGSILQNCIGSGYHDDNFKKNLYRYFFLHDRKGEPHVAISYQIKTHELSEVKGKQNKPPIGRYTACVANFINKKLDPEAAIKNYDVRNMGLALLPSGKLGHAAETGKVVFKIGDVRVFESEGVETEINDFDPNRDYFSKKIKGTDYSFVSAKEGLLFILSVGTNHHAWIKAIDEVNRPHDRALVKKFLNEYFEEAPAPMDLPSGSGLENKMDFLFGERDENDQRLEWYDYNTKKYGTVQEVGKKLASVGGYDCYLLGKSQGRNHVSNDVLVIDRQGTIVEEIDLVPGDGLRMGQMSWNDDFAPHSSIIPVLNAVGITPHADFDLDDRNRWRKKAKVFYDSEKKLWGSMAEACPKLWSRKGFAVHLRHEVADQRFLMFVKGDEFLLQLREGHAHLTIKNDTLLGARGGHGSVKMSAAMHTALQAALNECAELNKEMAGADLQEFNLFEIDGKWSRREEVSKPFHSFDDGSFITSMGDVSKTTYNFHTSDKEIIFALTLKEDLMVNHQTFGKGVIRVSRNVQWLLNHVEYGGDDVVNATDGYGGNANKAVLWNMGLFHDTRSDSWKLVQDGKVFWEGTDTRIVKFRNRYFAISSDDGCVGYFKLDGIRLESLHAMQNFSERDLYNILVDFLNTTVYIFDDSKDYSRGERRKIGFFSPQHGKLARIEDHYPTESVLELPKGFKWMRKAVDSDDHHSEMDVHGERYSLVDTKDRTVMRASFDGTHLEKVTFTSEDKLGRISSYSNLAAMSESQKKVLIMLMEKLGKKLLPQDARAFGYYRNGQGKYKPLKGNKALEGFLEGKIVFDDGVEFRCDRHQGTEWTLGMEDTSEGVREWERFQPIMKVTLDDDGIESVKYSKKEAKRSPKTYMPYLHKLMQIFHTVAGE